MLSQLQAPAATVRSLRTVLGVATRELGKYVGLCGGLPLVDLELILKPRRPKVWRVQTSSHWTRLNRQQPRPLVTADTEDGCHAVDPNHNAASPRHVG
jgi:hypothetical protein